MLSFLIGNVLEVYIFGGKNKFIINLKYLRASLPVYVNILFKEVVKNYSYYFYFNFFVFFIVIDFRLFYIGIAFILFCCKN